MVANPLTELVPKKNRTPPAIILVKFASKIVANDLRFPDLKAERTDLPSLSSSFIRSYVIMLASTAIPTPRINAAIPGSVMTAPIQSKTCSVIKI